MSYTALYRKFRPAVFEEVKGQDHIVATLRNQIRSDRIGHAYLFCGTRGTGKTSVAKIFAQAVNCEHPIDGSPCRTCAVCRAIAAQSSMNVIEIDAASNNGVDNIREIRDEVAYSPTEGKYKVYIIDEVHMLSIGAFNALLKTLEEPPSYVIFILATTEVHKIPITILSRCQRYDFRRISIETISERMEELLQIEEQEYEEKGIRYIAKAADGSMRDALSLLDQCISFNIGETLTYDRVLDVLGAVDNEVFGRLLNDVLEENVSDLMTLVEEIVMQGRELSQFITDFTWYLRNLLLLRGSDQMEEVLDVSSEQLTRLKADAGKVNSDTLMRYIRVFSDLSNQSRYATQKRILLELALIKLCKPQMEQDYSSILERLDHLEKKMEQGTFLPPGQQPGIQQNAGTSGTDGGNTGRETGAGGSPQTGTTVPLPKAVPEEVQEVVRNWPTIIRGASSMVSNFLKKGHLTLGGENQLDIVFDDDMIVEYFSEEQHREDVEELIAAHSGRKVTVRIRQNQSGRPFEDVFVNLQKIVKMPIEVEET